MWGYEVEVSIHVRGWGWGLSYLEEREIGGGVGVSIPGGRG